MKTKCMILFLMIILIFSSICLANNYQDFEEHNHKLLKFLKGLKGLEYETNNYIEDFEGYPDDTDKFAKQFYEDFINGKVEFIKPEYKTDDINDLKFQEYLKKYPKFKFESGEVLGDEEDFMIVNKKYPHYNYKVYQLDFDNNKSNGVEDIFYSGGYWNEEEDYGYSSYDILNKTNTIINPYFDTRAWIGGTLVNPEYEGKDKKRTKNFTGIIKYKDRYYIYEVLDWQIEISSWLEDQKRVATFLRYYY